jgi:DNA modification methylase
MAPEVALGALRDIPKTAVIADPMCGSGTVLKHAVELGHTCYGFDLDPMAVLLTRVACRRLSARLIRQSAEQLLNEASSLTHVGLPWIDNDPETREFVNYWFAETQQIELRQLSYSLIGKHGPAADALRVALSRTIITKDRGASLARDVSHSRPHKVRETNDYSVFDGFANAVASIARLVDRPTPGSVRVRMHDARRLPASMTGSVDLIITSPPYLNAIDYMRGHRMSLVWLGHQVGKLRETRSEAIGAERVPSPNDPEQPIYIPIADQLLPSRERGMLKRFNSDMRALMTQIYRVLKAGGEAIVVVGDSTIRGVFVENSAILAAAAASAGLALLDRRSRPLPASSRYLPPPSIGTTTLANRMRTEVVYHFRKPANSPA